MASKKELQEKLEIAEAIIAKQEELNSVEKNVTSKIQVGTTFVTICKVGDYIASFMPTNKKYNTPSIWISKNGRSGIAIPATKKGMDTLTGLTNLIEEKAELSA